MISFNPLHCGAVVASQPTAPAEEQPTVVVSIPFIAGQWSLLVRCGDDAEAQRRVSIPFIAGQWSLPVAAMRL